MYYASAISVFGKNKKSSGKNTPITIIPIVINNIGKTLTNARTVDIFPICVAMRRHIPYGGVTIPQASVKQVIIPR